MAADWILETHGLTKKFNEFVAVNDVNLRVRRGSIHALIGPNGAGKTTTFNLLTKFINPTSGTIHFNGLDITKYSPARIARMGISRSFQICAVFPHLTVLENVRLALQGKLRKTSLDFWRSDRSLDKLNDRAEDLISTVGLSSYENSIAAELPYSRKRTLELATTLALDPELMLLDEPTSGMSHEDVPLVSKLIESVSANRTILMVEHNLSFVANLSDTITVLARGTVLAEGTYREISQNPEVRTAYMGVAK
jgi:branched-chain amino acid transport system ATP-binding protein